MKLTNFERMLDLAGQKTLTENWRDAKIPPLESDESAIDYAHKLIQELIEDRSLTHEDRFRHLMNQFTELAERYEIFKEAVSDLQKTLPTPKSNLPFLTKD